MEIEFNEPLILGFFIVIFFIWIFALKPVSQTASGFDIKKRLKSATCWVLFAIIWFYIMKLFWTITELFFSWMDSAEHNDAIRWSFKETWNYVFLLSLVATFICVTRLYSLPEIGKEMIWQRERFHHANKHGAFKLGKGKVDSWLPDSTSDNKEQQLSSKNDET